MNSSLEVRYQRYRRWCIHVLGVYPASFAVWKQIEPTLIEKRRIAVLDDCLVEPSFPSPSMLDDLIFA